MAKTTYYPTKPRFEKLSKNYLIDLNFDLINAFSSVKNSLETALLIQDLLTANEIRQLAIRLRIAKFLLSTDNTYREIAKELQCSPATVTKVAIWLERGGEGLKKVIAKLPTRYELPKKLPQGPIEYHLPELLLALAKYSISTSQRKRTEKFMSSVHEKDTIDKELRERFGEEFAFQKTNKNRPK